MVALLGMDPKVALPIMMGACAFVGPIAMGITLGGVVGSVIALLFVTNMPTYWLKWLVVGVVIYTSVTMLSAGFKKDKYKNNKSVV